jgi:flagellar M-ring protein FliF
MNIKELLQNKKILYAVITAIGIFIFIIILIIALSAGGSKKAGGEVIDKIEKEPFEIVTTDNTGKAIEIQSILARQKINAKRKADGNKTTVFLEGGKYTNTQRDEALLLLVKSGLIDQNVGLEIFDKNDFTSTREDKRIKLARAVNGELSRLIRKMPNIDNASVLVSIPENSMFKADKKPISATVMLTVPSGTKLDPSVIKAIKSLLMGSVQDLAAENISITDSNGNVYNSLVKSLDDQIAKVQENDSYMQNKVAAQLDMLVGHGNYVVTVSTSLNQVPKEVTSIQYNPDEKTSLTEQTFNEGLGANSQDSSKGSDAVSVYLPNGLQNSSSTSSQNNNYSRDAKEITFGVSKKHTNELYKTGIVEKISIAVTMNADAMPPNMTMDELKAQIARAASPKVSPDDVSIAFAEAIDPYLASDRPANLPIPEASGNPWWLAVIILIIGLIVGFVFVHKKLKAAAEEQEKELKQLREKTKEQEKQIVDVNLKAAELVEKQSILAEELLAQQKQLQIEKKEGIDDSVSLEEVVEEVSNDIENADSKKTLEELKSWIEKS